MRHIIMRLLLLVLLAGCRAATSDDVTVTMTNPPTPLVTPHEIFLALGSTAEHRQASYRDLFRSELEPGLVEQIRQASNGNFALGSPRFAEEIAALLGRRVTPGKSGRPRKLPEPESGDLIM